MTDHVIQGTTCHAPSWYMRAFYALIVLLLVNGIACEGLHDDDDGRVTIEAVMPRHPTTQRDSYLCTRVEIPSDETFNVVQVEPLADKKQVHHMLLFGCEEYASEREADVWSCHMSPACTGMDSVLYGWGRNAPMVTLPDGVGFTIGKKSSMRALVLQVHYLELRTEKDASGIRIHLSRVPIQRVAGMQAFASMFTIPPGEARYPVKNSCCYDGIFPAHTFASRVHTHELGRRVTLYVNSPQEKKARSVVDLDPLKPQGFYPTKKDVTLLPGDVLHVTCDFNSKSQTEPVSAGMSSKDEMCNLYLMSHSVVPMFSMCVNGNKMVKQGHGVPSGSELIMARRLFRTNGLGQLSGVFYSNKYPEYLWVFHRGKRIWHESSFDLKMNVFVDDNVTRIDDKTISRVHIDSGRVEESFGSGLFLMPHMITEAPDGGVWMTDAGSHQVIKVVANKVVMTLGTFNVPGESRSRFCKPTEALETRDGRLLIADGYCNNRIVEMEAATGTFVRDYQIPVKNSLPHSIAYDECRSVAYIALRQAEKIIALDMQTGMFKAPHWDVSGFGYPYAVRMGMDGIPYALTWDMRTTTHLVELDKKLLKKSLAYRSWKLDGVESPHDFIFLPSPISSTDVIERNISILVSETRSKSSTAAVFVFHTSRKQGADPSLSNDNAAAHGDGNDRLKQGTVASHTSVEGLEQVDGTDGNAKHAVVDSKLKDDEPAKGNNGVASKFIFIFSLGLSGVVLWGFLQTFETSHKLTKILLNTKLRISTQMCSQEHKACGHAHSTHPEEELECDFGDLTLQSCCQRDLEEQRKIEGYKRTLLQRDPTAVRSTIARHAVVRDEERIACAIEDEDEEEDAILEALRQKRLEEMHASISKKQHIQHSGYGSVKEVKEDDIMEEDVITETICCLIHPKFSRSDDLKEYIEAVASRNREYRFITCCIQEPRSQLPTALGAKQQTDTVILLVCNNVVVGSITVLDDDAWGEAEIEDSILTSIQCHECVPNLQNIGSSSDEDDDDDGPPCDICGRRYPHEHK
ncbi:hypothetical protein M9435_003629 [Picochlorum sp. BPE23]|nr:hypothetical protein M9435_003629 [Picochlorum sp. BPE23]